MYAELSLDGQLTDYHRLTPPPVVPYGRVVSLPNSPPTPYPVLKGWQAHGRMCVPYPLTGSGTTCLFMCGSEERRRAASPHYHFRGGLRFGEGGQGGTVVIRSHADDRGTVARFDTRESHDGITFVPDREERSLMFLFHSITLLHPARTRRSRTQSGLTCRRAGRLLV